MSAILARWQEAIFATYSGETAAFLSRREDRFVDPVGSTIRRATGAILEGFARGVEPDGLASHLEEVVKIRAVQDFAPSKALCFVFQLRGILREEMAGEIASSPELWLDQDRKLEDLALMAFDQYVRCREMVHEIRVDEIRRRTAVLMRRLEKSRDEPDPG